LLTDKHAGLLGLGNAYATRNPGRNFASVISRQTHERVARVDGLTVSERRDLFHYSCTCKGFHRSTLTCSHILAVMHNDKTFDVHRLMNNFVAHFFLPYINIIIILLHSEMLSLGNRKRRGRPHKLVGALNGPKTLSLSNNPASVISKQVVIDNLVGCIVGYSKKEWVVRFPLI